MALSLGCIPLFTPDDLSWDPFFPYRKKIPSIPRAQLPDSSRQSPGLDLVCFLENLDTRLHDVWDDFSEYVRAANIATQCERSIDSELYQDLMFSIHYRLLCLQFDAVDINEAIRLALLAFASLIFLQIGPVKAPYGYLTRHLKSCLDLQRVNSEIIQAQLLLWLYIVGGISVFDKPKQFSSQPHLTAALQALGMSSWKDVRQSLKSVLWVDGRYDASAEQIVLAALPVP